MRHGHGRPGVPQPDRLASAVADARLLQRTDVSPSNTFFLQLDVGGASTATGAGVIDWWSNGGANQNWAFVNVSTDPNEFAIVNQNSGQCLTTNGYAGADVYQAPCDGVSDPNAQVWYTGLRLNAGADDSSSRVEYGHWFLPGCLWRQPVAGQRDRHLVLGRRCEPVLLRLLSEGRSAAVYSA